MVVPVSAVRDLYGTMIAEGAAKGILVTTSHYGRDSREFAKDKPISLIDGANLVHMFQKHGRNVQIVMLPKGDPIEGWDRQPANQAWHIALPTHHYFWRPPWIRKRWKNFVTAKIESLEDLYMVDEGTLAADQVRSLEVHDALVDAEATILSMPKQLIEQLGLRPHRERKPWISAGIADRPNLRGGSLDDPRARLRDRRGRGCGRLFRVDW